MNIDIDATYRDGALHPETPLNLPENTPVRVRVVALRRTKTSSYRRHLDLRPKSFVNELRNTECQSVPCQLTSRAKRIYSDHD